MFYGSFRIVITSLGKKRAGRCAFGMFVRFALVWFCLVSLPLGYRKGLWLKNVALPRLFSYVTIACVWCVSMIVKI